MARDLTIILGKIVQEDEFRNDVEQQGMVKAINEPGPEAAGFELVRSGHLYTARRDLNLQRFPSALIGRVEGTGPTTER